eukprot:5025024-Pleurochrysis_carterae.AAC.2
MVERFPSCDDSAVSTLEQIASLASDVAMKLASCAADCAQQEDARVEPRERGQPLRIVAAQRDAGVPRTATSQLLRMLTLCSV